jgi:glycerol-1-phosphate dehydrogenase [NAD(P)+]
MLDFGSSLPASGGEHHYSHFWEMKLLREGKPAILHGAKVGVAAIFIAGQYERIRRLSVDEAAHLLGKSRQPSVEGEMRRVRQAYGPLAEEVARTQALFFGMDRTAWEDLKKRVLDRWDKVREIAAAVPGPGELTQLLRRVGGPTNMHELGLPDSWKRQADEGALYLRNHFTVARLTRLLSLRF